MKRAFAEEIIILWVRRQSQLERVLCPAHHRPQRIPIDRVRLLESLFRGPIELGQIPDIPIGHYRVNHIIAEYPVPGHEIKRVAQADLRESVRDESGVVLLPKEHVENLIVIGRQISQQLVTILIRKLGHEVRYLSVVLKVVLEADQGEDLQLL